MTIHSQGVALVNNVMVQSEIETGRLVCPFNDVSASKNAFYLVYRDSQTELGKIAAFRQWILARAASEQKNFHFLLPIYTLNNLGCSKAVTPDPQVVHKKSMIGVNPQSQGVCNLKNDGYNDFRISP